MNSFKVLQRLVRANRRMAVSFAVSVSQKSEIELKLMDEVLGNL